MPVRIVAFAKSGPVFGGGQLRAIQPMGCGKLELLSQCQHLGFLPGKVQ
jgi:hypothetical protein